jgi:hypothetical protein
VEDQDYRDLHSGQRVKAHQDGDMWKVTDEHGQMAQYDTETFEARFQLIDDGMTSPEAAGPRMAGSGPKEDPLGHVTEVPVELIPEDQRTPEQEAEAAEKEGAVAPDPQPPLVGQQPTQDPPMIHRMRPDPTMRDEEG